MSASNFILVLLKMYLRIDMIFLFFAIREQSDSFYDSVFIPS